MSKWHCPLVLSRCADCDVGTITLGEYYMVKNRVWERAGKGRRKYSWQKGAPGQEILCIGCFEQRIGRKLVESDFTSAPCNDIGDYKSDRLLDRLGWG